jgi:Putative metallopeptidase
MKSLLSIAAVTGLALNSLAAPAEPLLRTDQVRGEYQEPTDPKHQPIRAAMQERRILEVLGALLNPFRLPRQLTLEVRGCNGREGAYYANDKAVLCYEYVELIQRHAPKVATPAGVTRADAIVGAILDTILHEVGHAVIEMLDIPVLGREEDAADFFSVYLLLQFPAADAQRLIEGVAFMMGSEAREDLEEKLRLQMFAGAHALNAQRHFNVLCLAYGSNPGLFNNVAPSGLPAWRAKNCGDEYAMLRRAFGRLILPHVDDAKLRDAMAQWRFDWSPLATAKDSFDAPPLGE